MNSFFADFDMYSNRIGFFLNEKEKISTLFGFFLTILYIVFSSILLVIFIINCINRTNVRIYDSILYSNDIPSIDINNNIFNFAFGLENPETNNIFIDEKIYTPKIIFYDKKRINGKFQIVNTSELEYELCKKENFGDNFTNIFKNNVLNNSYCLKNYNLSLIGGYSYNRMSYIEIKLYPCINNTQNNNRCGSQEIIDFYIKGGNVSIVMKDIGLDPIDYTFPVKTSSQNIFFNIDKSMYKHIILYYGITNINTDVGLFLQEIKSEKYIKFTKAIENFYFIDDSNNKRDELCSINFILDDKVNTIKRKYTKIYDIFSLLGGYMHILNSIFILLSSLRSNKLSPELNILNSIFNFNLKEKKMSMKIKSIKDFSSTFYKKPLFFQSDKKCSNSNTRIPNNNNISKNSLIANDNYDNSKNSHNLSKNCLIGIDNNNNNDINSSVNIFNNRKHNSLIVIKEKEKENEKSNSINNNNSEKRMSLFKTKNQLNNINYNNNYNSKDSYNNGNSNSNKRKQYIYRVGSFFPKYETPEKKKNEDNNSNLKEYAEQINFNIFDYYCLGKCTNKKKQIEIFKIGLSLYKTRMDIINVFSLLFFSEKNCLQSEELYG